MSSLFAAEVSLDQATRAVQQLHVESLLLPVFLQIIVIIAAARLFGMLASRYRQPTVVGEIIAGLLLGPSFFQHFFPETWAFLFRPQLADIPQPLADAIIPKIFAVMAQFGLIFLLFMVGMEFEFHHVRKHARSAILISISGVLFPFVLGAALAQLIYPYLEPLPATGKPVPLFGLTLFMGLAMAITAIPVLGRIMIELGIQKTRLGTITITAAAVDDAVGWILLATVAALAQFGTAAYDVYSALRMLALTVAFVLVMWLIARPLLIHFFRSDFRRNQGSLSLTGLAVFLISLMLAATATNVIGIFAVFGAFVLGSALSDQHELRSAITSRVRDLIGSFFLPIFFTYTGLQTDIRALSQLNLWVIAIAVLAVAVLGKLVGCGIAARLSGYSIKEATMIGVLMNTRGLMALVVINAGRQLGVIPPSLDSILVIVAVITTIMTTPLILALRKGTEIDEPISRAGFLKRADLVPPMSPVAELTSKPI